MSITFNELQTSSMNAGDFLHCLYGDEPPGYLVLWTRQDKQTHCGQAVNLQSAGRYAEKLSTAYDVYYGVGLQGQKPTGHSRGTAEGVIAIPGLWIDIDIQGPGHKATNLPSDIGEAEELLRTFPLPPTMIVASGGGLHVYWLFKELWTFDSDEERQEAQLLARRFQATIIGLAVERGWKVDATHDLARVLRLPGTINHKGDPVPVRVLQHDDFQRYNPDDFDMYLVDVDQIAAPASSNGVHKSEEYPPADLNKIITKCAWIKHCKDDAATLPEPEWYAMLSIVGRCEDGRKYAHEWSKAYPSYSSQETDAKLQQALEASGPRTCADIRANGGEPYCAGCSLWGKITSPAVLGLPDRLSRTDMPKIDASQGNLAKLADEAWDALEEWNTPPKLFQRGGLITSINVGDTGEPELTIVTESGMRGILARAAWWYRWQKAGDETFPVDALPPITVVKDMMAARQHSQAEGMRLPIITRLVEAPVFGAGGSLKVDPGYHEGSRTYYWDGGLVVNPPDPSQLDRARDLILDDLLGDFPFTSDSERAHAVAAILAPFVREMIEGPVPLHMIEAPSPGTGKSLLADAITIPATGRPAAVMTEGRDEDEWRKRITAMMVAAPTYLLIDNIRRKLDSAALAAALTSQTWQDRILGRTELTTLPARSIWLATGNNPSLTTEMARRTVRIRMDAKVARPWRRGGFKHADLRTWARRNRGELVWAILTMVQAWIDAGKPSGKESLGQYESWAAVIGGILDVCGINGFLSNIEELYEAADEETAEWEEFLAAWWEEFGDTSQVLKDLFNLAADRELLLTVRGDRSEQSQRVRLGRALTQMIDRQIGPWKIVNLGRDSRTKTVLYKLENVSEATGEEYDDEAPF